MDIKNIPFNTTNWSQIPATEHKGETGVATWRTQQFDHIRLSPLQSVTSLSLSDT